MARDWHRLDTVPLHNSATNPIELSVGGGLGCPNGAARANERNGAG